MELTPSKSQYLLAAMVRGARVFGFVLLALGSSWLMRLVLGRNQEPLGSLLTEYLVTAAALGLVSVILSLVLNLGRAPSRLAITGDGLTVVIDRTPRTITWSDVRTVEYPQRRAWQVQLTSGQSIEIWPFAYTSSERITLRQLLTAHLGERSA